MEHVSKTAAEIRQRLEADLERTLAYPTNQSSETCAFCSGTGYARCDAGVVRCECQRLKVIAEKMAQIPKRFRGVSLGNYVPIDGQQERALDAICRAPTGSFFLFGQYARGKTHLATAQYIELVKLERPCLFLSMAELISELRKSELDPDYFCVVRQRVRYTDPFHLFLDDIDKFKATGSRQRRCLTCSTQSTNVNSA